jgi:predicted MFS family arabinose efflux permease
MTHTSVLVFACAFGVMFLARNTVGFLTPEMAPALQLQARHLGLLSAVLAGGWAISGWLVPRFIRQHWNTHTVLAVLLIVLAIDCIATSMAAGFAWLFACRLVCGVTGGPVLPLIQGTVAHSVRLEHRGFYMGMVQGIGGSLIAAIIAPVVLVPVAERFGWHVDFLLIAAVALFVACAVHTLNPAAVAPLHQSADVTTQERAQREDHLNSFTRHGTRNIVLCCLIGSLMVSWLVLTTTFFPVYLTSINRVSASEMSLLMALIGVGSLIGVLLLPYLSDYLGRRLLLGFAVVGALAPTALLLNGLSIYSMGALLFIGSTAGGTFPLFLAIVPSESVRRNKISASIGIVQAACELIGGVLVPIWVGWLANRHGLQLPVIVALCSAIAAGVLAVGIRLNNPASGKFAS